MMERLAFYLRAALWIILFISPAFDAQSCPSGYYGDNCLYPCSASCVNTQCHITTGICDQCPSGVTGNYCNQACSSTTWGPRCVYTCSVNCKNRVCNGETGKCNECPSGKTGDQCNQNCPPTTYGSRCVNTCSTNCVNSYCTGDNGRCDNCPAGKTGDRCDTTCSSTTWGPRCVNTCSVNCKNQQCNAVTGRCDECPSGKTGDQCDQACSSTKWGPRCVNTCSLSCKNQQCNAVTGRCDECPSGKTGDQCGQDCPRTQYGSRCVKTCSTNCVNSYCTGDNGRCDNCPAGKTGDLCDTNCQLGWYGPRCTTRCSINCVDRLCDRENGRCNQCPAGKIGDLCDQDCPPTQYGARCIHACSTKCVNQYCNRVTGICNNCPPGKTGDQCEQDCPPTRYGDRCVELCDSNCVDSKCIGTNGTCLNCPSGKTGDVCNKDCPATVYGPRCINTCSTNCLDSRCNGSTGECNQCPNGKIGEQCDQDCPLGLYGQACRETCSENCHVSRDCDPTIGTCVNGCGDGYMGDLCNRVCGIGKYGTRCVYNCSEFCNTIGLTDQDTSCHHINGTCLYGCDEKHEGVMCQAVKLASTSDNTVVIGAIVGAIGVVVIVTLIVAGVLLRRRKQNTRRDGIDMLANNNKKSGASKTDKKTEVMDPEMRRSGNTFENVEIAAGSNHVKIVTPNVRAETTKTHKPDVMPKPSAKPKKGDKSVNYENTSDLARSQSTLISVGELQAFMATHSADFFKTQFESIPDNENATCKIGQSAENIHKNTYKDVCAYDHSRVCLQINKGKGYGDYINASYIEGYNREEKFIASQGPTRNMVDDFIRMLWEQKVEKVVMFNLIEEGEIDQECEKYWLADEVLHFGDFRMDLTTTEVFADYTIRRLRLSKEEEVQPVTHFHFTSWPDRGVPTTPWGLVDFEQRVASYPSDKPVVVHSSAGVGRTGTFIALRNVLREAKDTGYVDFFTTVRKLKKDRINMVQTVEQYEFIHRAAQVAILCSGTNVTSADIQDRITTLESTTKSGETLLELEFKAICSVCADDGESTVKQDPVGDSGKVFYENSRQMTNKIKDRMDNVPAKEEYRTVLACENDDMGDYINAVLVHSFRKTYHQILTHLPQPTTATDFWRLVTQYKVALVVALELESDGKDSPIPEYLPQKKGFTMSVPLFKIKSCAISHGDISEVQVTVEVAGIDNRRESTLEFVDGQHNLTHVRYTSTDLNPQKLLTFIKDLREQLPGPEGRIIYMCRNGASYSGLMCVLTLLLDRLDNDLLVSVLWLLVLSNLSGLKLFLHWNNTNYCIKCYTSTNNQSNDCNNLGEAVD